MHRRVITPFLRLLRLPRRLLREFIIGCEIVRFFLANRFGFRHLTEPSGPVVSMTTWGQRSQTVYLTIESIATGQIRPSRLILWIDEESIFRNLPATLRRLQKRGLEVKLCANYGPHKKYYPYVEAQELFVMPLVTADDDMLYPACWLEKLLEANWQHPEDVNCFWGHAIALNEHGMERPGEWKQCHSTRPSFRHIAAGVTGVIYPPSFLTALKRAGAAFQSCCPKADDIWLHAQALRSGHKIRMILPRLPYFSFLGLPGTYSSALCIANVEGEGNDAQAKATYCESDIQILLEEAISDVPSVGARGNRLGPNGNPAALTGMES